MAHNRVSLPGFAIFWLLLTQTTAPSQEPPALPAPSRGSAVRSVPPAITPEVAGTVSGNELLRQASAKLAQYPGLETKIRQRVDLFGVQLVGTGVYRRLGTGLDAPQRLEMKLQSGDRVSLLLQVCDKRYLWTYTDHDGRTQLTRIDVQRVKAAAESTGPLAGHPPAGQSPAKPPLSMNDLTSARTPARTASQTNPAPSPGASSSGTPAEASLALTTLGGIPALVENLERSFHFPAIQERAIENTRVYVLQGTWTPQKLAELLPDQRDKILAGEKPDLTKLPPQLPHQVVVALTKSDLFPYHVEFQRPPTREEQRAQPATNDAGLKTILALELFDPRLTTTFPAGAFQYQSAAQEVIDLTARYVK